MVSAPLSPASWVARVVSSVLPEWEQVTTRLFSPRPFGQR